MWMGLSSVLCNGYMRCVLWKGRKPRGKVPRSVTDSLDQRRSCVLSVTARAKNAERALRQALINRFGWRHGALAGLQLCHDHGLVFGFRLYRRIVHEYGLTQEYIPPYTPEENGPVERFIAPSKKNAFGSTTSIRSMTLAASSPRGPIGTAPRTPSGFKRLDASEILGATNGSQGMTTCCPTIDGTPQPTNSNACAFRVENHFYSKTSLNSWRRFIESIVLT